MAVIGWKGWSLIAFVVLVAALIGLIYRHSILATNPILLAVQVASVLLMIWARLTLGVRSFHATANPTAGGLITGGPYRFVRHPMYAAILYFITAALVSHFSLVNALLVVVAAIGVSVRILGEERLLTQEFPEYMTYALHTKRVIPFVL